MAKVLDMQNVNLKLKLKLLDSCVILVLTYGAESCTVIRKDGWQYGCVQNEMAQKNDENQLRISDS